ncbi:MAG TPA: hypothetical protein VFX34_02835, partial [Sporosarcina sp.]|nr:hypothetical protein [Sporosarcina sp.]
MKKGIVLAIIFISFILGVKEVTAKEDAQRYIGLHDKMLPIEYITEIDGDTKVLFKDITKHLYIDVTEEKGALKLNKHGKEIILPMPAKSDAAQTGSPLFIDESGELLISLSYLADQFEFKLQYF